MDLKVNEIFYSIQGESSFAGRPCVFIRLSGCNLRCSYCDTQYAYEEGQAYSIENTIGIAESYGCSLIEVTGGEPLLQKATPILINDLLNKGFQVLIETNGSKDISLVSTECIKIVDIKCPSSGEQDHNDMENLNRLSSKDEIKFVICNRHDYEFAKNIVSEYLIPIGLGPSRIHFSSVFNKLSLQVLAEWLLEDRLSARMQLQLHKYIWDPDTRGV